MNLDFLSGFILFYMNYRFLIPLIFFGYYLGKEKFFTNTCLLAFFALVINAYLKQVWQFPLNPEVGKIGWAYPSGHTSLNVVFWGSLCMQFRKKRLISWSLTLLCLGTCSMVYVGYHDWPDIFGGACLGLLILVPFYYKVKYFNNISPLAWGTALHLICLGMLLFIFNHSLRHYNWLLLTQGMMNAMLFIEFMRSKGLINLKISPKPVLMNFLLAIGVLYLILSNAHTMEASYSIFFIKGWTTSFIVFLLIPKMIAQLYLKLEKANKVNPLMRYITAS
jgi:hypothetical protein